VPVGAAPSRGSLITLRRLQMKPRLTKLAASVVVTGLSVAGSGAKRDMSSLPPIQVQGAVSFITGGIGEEEAAAFKFAAAAYPLEMLFVQKARPGTKSCRLRVSVRNRFGNYCWIRLPRTLSCCQLPAGKYRIEAEIRSERKTQTGRDSLRTASARGIVWR